MTVRSLFLKSRNKFTVDVLDTTATHAGVVLRHKMTTLADVFSRNSNVDW